MQRLLLDANVLIRFLRADHAQHFKRAKALFEKTEAGEVQLVLLDAVVAEVVYVLSSVYGVKRPELAQALRPFLFHGGIECPGALVLEDALARFVAKKVDFMDAYLAAQAKAMGVPVGSFDKDFRKFPDVECKGL